MEESRKVYGWLVRDRNAAVGCSSMWADTMGGECYCGNLLWQSSLTLLSPDATDSGAARNACAIDKTVVPHVYWFWDEQSGVPIWTNAVKTAEGWERR